MGTHRNTNAYHNSIRHRYDQICAFLVGRCILPACGAEAGCIKEQKAKLKAMTTRGKKQPVYRAESSSSGAAPKRKSPSAFAYHFPLEYLLNNHVILQQATQRLKSFARRRIHPLPAPPACPNLISRPVETLQPESAGYRPRIHPLLGPPACSNRIPRPVITLQPESASYRLR